jgi:CubicO group peptidase (beta-lactamase class C family)
VAAIAELQVEVEPSEVGLDPERLERLDAWLSRYVDAGRIPSGVVVVARGGRVAPIATAGHRDPRDESPLELDAIWRIYSMTKPITCAAALMLWEEGAFELTDPVSNFIPAFENVRVYRGGPPHAPSTTPAQEPMRIWHLFTHTSGMTYGFFYSTVVDALYRAAGFEPFVDKEAYTLEEACDRWAKLPLLFEPGTEWNYSVAHDVLGRVIEVASGKSLDEFFAERIFEPLGMTDSGFWVPEEKHERVAAMYTTKPGTSEAVPHPQVMTFRREKPSFFGGGGGLYSTAHDYNRFVQMLAGAGEVDGVRVLARKTVELMTQNHLPGGADLAEIGRPLYVDDPPTSGVGFGLGVSVMLDPAQAKIAGSPGLFRWGGAANTDFFVDPAEEVTGAFYTQLLPAYNPIRRQYRQLIYQAIA